MPSKRKVLNMVDWHQEHLSLEDIFAGGSLFLIGISSIFLYSIVVYMMKKHDKEIIGYRFLISSGITDILLLINYGVWPGLTILLKSEIIPKQWRSPQQLYLDWIWFTMVLHYTIVSWSRWMAIRLPVSFRSQTKSFSYLLCASCYLIALLFVLSTHFQPWYVVFYYEPSQYGMLAENFTAYLSGGQSTMFLTFHISAIIPPAFFYSYAIFLLYQRRRLNASANIHSQNNIESRLLLPCLINLINFIVGQIVITLGTGSGKWAGYMVMLLFSANATLNPLLLLACSSSLRKQFLCIFGLAKHVIADRSSFNRSSRAHTKLIVNKHSETLLYSYLPRTESKSPSPL